MHSQVRVENCGQSLVLKAKPYRISFPLFLLLALVSQCLVSRAPGAVWAAKLFKETHHDFGTVSRNAKTDFAFVLENTFEEEIHIASVRSSCGCTKPTITKNNLKSWEKGEIVAEFNTRAFIGQKSAMITVVIDRPYYAEVQLTVSGNIRSDIVTEPGEARFGDIDRGTSREIPVTISYAGRSDWKILDVRGNSEHLEVRMDPDRRDRGQVGYTLRVKIKDTAPVGDIQDELIVVTNDVNTAQFSFPVSAKILPPVSITPNMVSLGSVAQGQVIQNRLLVRGKQPFEIQEIVCEDPRFTFRAPPGSKPLHVVPFDFKGDTHAGEIRQKVIVKTNLGQSLTAECLVSATVIR